MSAPSTSGANLEYYRKQAKALLKAHAAGRPDACARFRQHVPRLAGRPDAEILAARLTLSDAQLVLARENGCPSWPRFKAHVESLNRAARHRPLCTDLAWFEDRARGVVSAHHDGIPTGIRQIQRHLPAFAGRTEAEVARAPVTLEDARLVIAREHGFDTWDVFSGHLNSLAGGETVEPFLTAFEALKAGDLPKLRALLAQHADLPNAPGTNGNTLLNLAVSCKQPEAVQLLLELGADPDLGNRYGWTPLHQAGYSNQSDVARRLLAAGASADLSARGDGGTPLVQALFWGHRKTSELLAESGVVPHNLRVAAGLGRVDLLESFFGSDGRLTPEAGAHREFYRPHPGFPAWTPSDDPQEILDEAFVYAAKSARIEAMDFLLRRGARIDAEPYNGTALHWAVSGGHVETATWLLDHGADPNGKPHFGGATGVTPLHNAASGGRVEMVRFLLDRGADLAIHDDEYHSTPLGWADHFGRDEVRELILTSYADRVAADDLVRFDQIDRLVERLDREPGLARASEDGYTLLRQAAASGRPAIADLLLARGADPSLADRQGKTPLDLALENGHDAVARLLRQAIAR